MNGGLDSHTMKDRSLIGSRLAGINTLRVYNAPKCDSSKKQEVSLRRRRAAVKHKAFAFRESQS